MNPALSAFRFYLAVCVLASHFVGPGIWGSGSVETFFCISGFLVTWIVTEQYAGRPFDYLFNRFLRIYPVYWACLAIGIAVVAIFPVTALAVDRTLFLPTTPAGWASQFTIFGLYRVSNITQPQLLPTGWSLNVELYFYLVIGLVTAFRPRLTIALAAISTMIFVLAGAHILPIPSYGDPIGNAQPFFLGSLAYHLRDRVEQRWAPAILGAFVFIQLVPLGRFEWQVLLSSLVAPLAVVIVWNMRLAFPTRVERLADLLGKLSYPVFLLHWSVAVPFAALGLGQVTQFALVLPLTLAIALGVHAAVERPLESLRQRIRRQPLQASPRPV